MNPDLKIMHVDLHLFDGEGAAAPAGGAETSGTTQPAELEFPGLPPKKAAKTGEDLSQVHYGTSNEPAQASQGEEVQANQAQDAAAAETPEDLRKEFRELTKGKFKDVYGQEVQRILDRRLKESKSAQEQFAQAKPILDGLAQRYGLNNADDLDKLSEAFNADDSMLEGAAEEAGMSVSQFREFRRLQLQNDVLMNAQKLEEERAQQKETAEKWFNEAQETKATYADFDLQAELEDPNFVAALQAGVPMKLIYQGKYFDKLLPQATAYAATQAQKAVTENIRAKGQRPTENGASSQSTPIITKTDPSKLDLNDFEEIARRVARGERITFG